MFDGFRLEHIRVGDGITLRVRHGGSGPPLLLLHGHPRTHATWHRVAPLLAGCHTVVCPDLRGYGESTKPAALPDHAQQSKRAMAADMRALMQALAHRRFSVAGHDRGAYVAFRLAMDHPAAVQRLRCPTLVLSALRDDMELLYGSPLRVWRTWADDLQGQGIDCGHHIAEEAPRALADALERFLHPPPARRIDMSGMALARKRRTQ